MIELTVLHINKKWKRHIMIFRQNNKTARVGNNRFTHELHRSISPKPDS